MSQIYVAWGGSMVTGRVNVLLLCRCYFTMSHVWNIPEPSCVGVLAVSPAHYLRISREDTKTMVQVRPVYVFVL